MPDSLEPFRSAKYMSLTSYRKDGSGVPTTVWFAIEDDRLLMRTDSESYKVKRMRTNPAVTVAPSTARGEVKGDAHPGEAKELPASEGKRISRIYLRRYPIGYTWEIVALRPLHGLLGAIGIGRKRGRPLFFEILLTRVLLAVSAFHLPEAAGI
jgi:PPOX class probable F420-dependent enzyme